MKNISEKHRHHEIYTFIITLVVAVAVCFGGFSDNIALAVASVMFYSGETVTETETVRAVSALPSSTEAQTVAVGERVAQMVIAPYFTADFELCDELSDTVRGEGGFGSTGRK